MGRSRDISYLEPMKYSYSHYILFLSVCQMLLTRLGLFDTISIPKPKRLPMTYLFALILGYLIGAYRNQILEFLKKTYQEVKQEIEND